MNKDDKWIKYGKLLAGLIHNLNTPLMGVSGRAELLQMKLGEDKSIANIISQVERLSSMLTAAGYLVDKDLFNKVIESDINLILDNYYNFITADMRYKHHTQHKTEFVPVKKEINPCDLLHVLHFLTDYLLCFIDDETSIFVTNDTVPVIKIMMKNKNSLPSEFNLDKVIKEKLYEDMDTKFQINYSVFENTVEITINFV
jgi:hypothetical protein